MYNVTRWRVRVAIVVKENQQRVLCVLLSYMSLSTIQKYSVLHKNYFMVNFFSPLSLTRTYTYAFL
jgi:hypothetical protein